MPGETNHIVLIGDLVRSRSLSPRRRRDLQEKLSDHLTKLNETSAVGIRAELLITLGDEFQGVFSASVEGASALVRTLTSTPEVCRPTLARFGIGIGTLTTELRRQALGMDGPSFHRARKALETLKSERLLCRLVYRGTACEETWSLLASSAIRQQYDWTDAQWEVVQSIRELRTGRSVAEALKITPSAVSQRLTAARWDFHARSIEVMRAALIEIAAQPESGKG